MIVLTCMGEGLGALRVGAGPVGSPCESTDALESRRAGVVPARAGEGGRILAALAAVRCMSVEVSGVPGREVDVRVRRKPCGAGLPCRYVPGTRRPGSPSVAVLVVAVRSPMAGDGARARTGAVSWRPRTCEGSSRSRAGVDVGTAPGVRSTRTGPGRWARTGLDVGVSLPADGVVVEEAAAAAALAAAAPLNGQQHRRRNRVSFNSKHIPGLLPWCVRHLLAGWGSWPSSSCGASVARAPSIQGVVVLNGDSVRLRDATSSTRSRRCCAGGSVGRLIVAARDIRQRLRTIRVGKPQVAQRRGDVVRIRGTGQSAARFCGGTSGFRFGFCSLSIRQPVNSRSSG